MTDAYRQFLERKVAIAPKLGFEVSPDDAMNPGLRPHCRVLVPWMLQGGRRALFTAFGLHKSAMQLEAVRIASEHVGGRGLIVCPLGVRQEFIRDAVTHLHWPEPPKFIRRIEDAGETGVYLTNYETVRDGKLDPRRAREGAGWVRAGPCGWFGRDLRCDGPVSDQRKQVGRRNESRRRHPARGCSMTAYDVEQAGKCSMSTMTLEQVRDRLRDVDGGPIVWAEEGRELADAIDAHLAQTAQAVDVGAIREVIDALRNMGGKPNNIYNLAADKLTRAISGEKAGPVDGWQPIETAPKDGTPIFIPYCGRPVPAAWDAGDAMWRWKFLSRGMENAYEEGAVKLWHPMLFPASPAPDKEG